jgi:hypothetical protein
VYYALFLIQVFIVQVTEYLPFLLGHAVYLIETLFPQADDVGVFSLAEYTRISFALLSSSVWLILFLYHAGT